MKLSRISILSLVLLFSVFSCGVIGIINGYDHYVGKDQFGRKKLKKELYKKEFHKYMNRNLCFDSIYYNYYENSEINYKRHSYLRLFPTGQYIFFSDSVELNDLNNLKRRGLIGYYIVKKDSILQLETASGNFNTSSFRVIWKYKITENGLVETKKKSIYPEEFILKDLHNFSLNDKPDW